MARMVTHFTFRLILNVSGASKHRCETTISYDEKWFHTRSITAALLGVTMADDFTAKQAYGTFLKLFFASSALESVILLNQSIEIWW